MVLWKKIIIGMVAGIAMGLFFNEFEEYREYVSFIKPLGDIFIKLLKLIAIPLIFTSIVAGITGLSDPDSVGRIGIRAILTYMATTVFAISIGLFFAGIIKPGVGDFGTISTESTFDKKELPSFLDTLIDIFPDNIFFSLAEGKVLQVIVFAVFFGLAINLCKERGKRLAELNDDLQMIFEKIILMIIKFAPYGVFALMTSVIAQQGIEIIQSLFWFILTFLIAGSLHVIIVYGGLLKYFSDMTFKRFFKHGLQPILFGFSTSSSSATLPVTMKAAEDMGISEEVRGLVIPIGSTVNMDGTALYQGICVFFVAQMFGIDLSTTEILTVVATAVLASVGTAGVPGVGLVTLTIIFDAVGLPLEGIAIILGVDRILDMIRTSINITGDLTVSASVDKYE